MDDDLLEQTRGAAAVVAVDDGPDAGSLGSGTVPQRHRGQRICRCGRLPPATRTARSSSSQEVPDRPNDTVRYQNSPSAQAVAV